MENLDVTRAEQAVRSLLFWRARRALCLVALLIRKQTAVNILMWGFWWICFLLGKQLLGPRIETSLALEETDSRSHSPKSGMKIPVAFQPHPP